MIVRGSRRIISLRILVLILGVNSLLSDGLKISSFVVFPGGFVFLAIFLLCASFSYASNDAEIEKYRERVQEYPDNQQYKEMLRYLLIKKATSIASGEINE